MTILALCKCHWRLKLDLGIGVQTLLDVSKTITSCEAEFFDRHRELSFRSPEDGKMNHFTSSAPSKPLALVLTDDLETKSPLVPRSCIPSDTEGTCISELIIFYILLPVGALVLMVSQKRFKVDT